MLFNEKNDYLIFSIMLREVRMDNSRDLKLYISEIMGIRI